MDLDLGGITATIDLNTGNMTQNMANAQAGMGQIQQRLGQLQAGFQNGSLSAEDLAKHLDTLRATYVQLDQVMHAMQAAANGSAATFVTMGAAASRAGQAAGAAGNAGGDAAMKYLYLGRAIEDAQFGFQAIVNNIPQLVQAMGGSAGMAGAVNIAAVAVNQWIRHWDDFLTAVPEVKGAIQSIQMAMRDLGQAFEKNGGAIGGFVSGLVNGLGPAADRAQERAEEENKRADAALKGLRDMGGPRDADAGKAVREILERRPGGAGGLIDQLAGAEGSVDPLDAAAVARLQARRRQAALMIQGAMAGEEQHLGQLRMAAPDVARELGEKQQRQLDVSDAEAEAEQRHEEADRLARQVRRAREAERREQQAEDQDRQRDEAENLAAFRRARERNARRVGAVADDLFKGEAGAEALRGNLSEEGVAGAMRRAGYSEETIERRAGEVAEALAKKVTDAIREHALQGGMDLGAARDDLLNEREERAAQEARTRAGRAGRAVREAFPGAEAHARRGLLEAEVAGMGPQEAARAVSEAMVAALKDSGMDPERLRAGIEQVVEAAGIQLGRDVEAGALEPPDRRSEVLSGADLANRIQSSIGGPEDTQKEMVRHLADIKRQMAQLVQDTEQAARQPAVAVLN